MDTNSHATEKSLTIHSYVDVWPSTSASYSVNRKHKELRSRLTAQCMYWCLVRFFWTFCRKGLRTCGRSFIILLYYSLSLVITLGNTITNNFVQITTPVWSDNSYKITVVLRTLVHDWYALLLYVLLLCGSKNPTFRQCFHTSTQ